MKELKDLLEGVSNISVHGSLDIQISGVSANSQTVRAGGLFIAKKGINSNGAKYIPDALNKGAAAILTDSFDSKHSQITQLVTTDIEDAEVLLASKFYGEPNQQLLMVGVTGTNGKTTTAYLIKYLLDNLRGLCGLIGTVEYHVGGCTIPATHTTPDATTNQQLLSNMVNSGAKFAVMEVSSHALVQGRVNGIDFDVAVYTNLSPDHLDYHQTMENYASAKNLLFRNMSNERKDSYRFKSAVVNRDDPYVESILAGCPVQTFSYGIDSDADLVANDISFEDGGTSFTLFYEGKCYSCHTPLIGRYNVYNTLAAIGVVLTQGYSIEDVVKLTPSLPPVPGRMEMVQNGLGLKIVVDFAHTADALENLLACVSEMKPERLITVFGCGGDRDRGKRPEMGRVSGKWSDISIVTSDNPRSENPLSIISEIVAGFGDNQKHLVEIDREVAISKAIEVAKPQDVVVIAGKGHETTQTSSSQTIEFDDRKIVRKLCHAKQAAH
ncbi:MAG: UDP-N-acetylmuramoyl-L-alanyl-D-glutamate--2,6-diaminopimelate ligase [Chlamydiota bacterium]